MTEDNNDLIRKMLKEQRKQLSLEFQRRISQQICKNIQESALFHQSQDVAFYCAANGEINLKSLELEAHRQGKNCYYPVMTAAQTLEFYPVTPETQFEANAFKINEPVHTKGTAIDVTQLDLILVPLVAFDRKGHRLGMGAGFYDRTLAPLTLLDKRSTMLLGVAYEFQRRENIIQYEWDVPLDGVITEREFYGVTNK